MEYLEESQKLPAGLHTFYADLLNLKGDPKYKEAVGRAYNYCLNADLSFVDSTSKEGRMLQAYADNSVDHDSRYQLDVLRWFKVQRPDTTANHLYRMALGNVVTVFHSTPRQNVYSIMGNGLRNAPSEGKFLFDI